MIGEGEEGEGGEQVITLVTLTFRVWGFRVEPIYLTLLVEPVKGNPCSLHVLLLLLLLLLAVLKSQPMVLLWTPNFTINPITLLPITHYPITLLPFYHITILPYKR